MYTTPLCCTSTLYTFSHTVSTNQSSVAGAPYEEGFVKDFRINNFKIPSDRTTYRDFSWDFPECADGECHIVVGQPGAEEDYTPSTSPRLRCVDSK